jgi:ubiquinone/menaquinone biosynthesis C-methylase UbiE
MMPDATDAERSRRFYDELGIIEWDRMGRSVASRVSMELHRRLLARFIAPGARVLEIGAGPGRFTIELAKLGAMVVVSDISPVQLELNERMVAEAGAESHVEDRIVLDVADLSVIPDVSFDAVVAFGGPLSYVFDAAESALGGCLRVTRPGGTVLASVMSLVGSLRYHLAGVAEEMSVFGAGVIDTMVRTGEQRYTPHQCRMFRWSEIADMVKRLPCELEVASASNAISSGDPEVLDSFERDADRWERLLSWEEQLAKEPGTLDAGTHIIFAVRRSSPKS